jgi:DNA-binding PadR family transcriptional regulator
LGLLTDGPRHGYDLKALYDETFAPTVKLNFGQVYPTLDRLRRDGLVQQQVVSQEDRPDKKAYSLTERGRAELQAWLDAPSTPNLDIRNETFIKLMLARRIPGAVPVEILRAERRACLARLHDAMQARTRAEQDHDTLQTVLLLDLAVLRLEAFLKWLERCDESLREEIPSEHD